MNKVYCQDCKNCSGETFNDFNCIEVMDDFYSPAHQVKRSPAVLNWKNKCPYFEMKKSGK